MSPFAQLLAPFLVFAGFASSQDPAPPAAEPAPTAAAQAELHRALRFLHALPACQLRLVEADPQGLTIDVRVAAERFAVVVGRDGRVFDKHVSDGRRMLTDRWQKHEITDAPKDFQAWLRATSSAGSDESARFFGLVTLQGLWGGASDDPALLAAKKVVARGVETVAGRPCARLAVRDRDLECEVWVQQGDEPWIRRFRPRPDQYGVMDYTAGDMAFDEATEWRREVPADAFALQASEGSVLVADLQKAMAAERAERDAAVAADIAAEMEATGDGPPVVDEQNQPVTKESAPHPSQGKRAPDVTLTLLDDSTVRLADLQGKVVVLDFWATWCGPCCLGLPKLAETTRKLADRGVVFYALNLEQTRRTVRRHLRDEKLDVLAAVVDRPILDAFGVRGVPHTVVVDPAGVIHKVHIGYTPGDETTLEQAVLAALAAPRPTPASAPKPKAAPAQDK